MSANPRAGYPTQSHNSFAGVDINMVDRPAENEGLPEYRSSPRPSIIRGEAHHVPHFDPLRDSS